MTKHALDVEELQVDTFHTTATVSAEPPLWTVWSMHAECNTIMCTMESSCMAN